MGKAEVESFTLEFQQPNITELNLTKLFEILKAKENKDFSIKVLKNSSFEIDIRNGNDNDIKVFHT